MVETDSEVERTKEDFLSPSAHLSLKLQVSLLHKEQTTLSKTEASG
jgi:hypothetical protein